MSKLTYRELMQLIDSTRERAMILLSLSDDMAQKSYKFPSGVKPTKNDINDIYTRYKEHLALVEKFRNIKHSMEVST